MQDTRRPNPISLPTKWDLLRSTRYLVQVPGTPASIIKTFTWYNTSYAYVVAIIRDSVQVSYVTVTGGEKWSKGVIRRTRTRLSSLFPESEIVSGNSPQRHCQGLSNTEYTTSLVRLHVSIDSHLSELPIRMRK